MPPAPVRALRHYTRARTHLTQDRTRCWQRLEKLLEDALIKVSAVASRMNSVSVRDMLAALIAGERDPVVLAGLARTRMRAKRAALTEALCTAPRTRSSGQSLPRCRSDTTLCCQ